MPRPQTFAALRTASDAPGFVLVLDERPGALSSCVLARDASASPLTSPTLMARALAKPSKLWQGGSFGGPFELFGLERVPRHLECQPNRF